MNKEQHINNNDVPSLMLQQEPIKEFEHWKIIQAWFPYKNTYLHHLLVPKKVFTSLEQLPQEYIIELIQIENDILAGNDYDYIRTNGDNKRSVKNLLHKHLIKE